ncbi:bifunctional riboflavin kinase/FAD synthetase [Flavobacterium sp. NKUCC04_CG]|uniref:bifunctional riboflavin kinase/FAD synthetase n=1 Tax=Flavobacterium sp. NKUCC04_CG TaxID=2842121 RepID=UPI001C5ABB5B|nr:bifunctional riboflavin kinase/FAD synthetase [Flavobacterium sp. NKUCC04_CG]MBW3520145.1 bifunctional riboflavin kinase/FAD synthetase [Flavobacterium sp. NKUCC04_CG]
MKTYSSIYNYHSNQKTIVTLGTFDGVHLGHQMIIRKLVTASKLLGGESLVLTFFPHPRMVLKQDDSIKLLNTMEEKIALLERYGLDNLVIHTFDKDFSQLSAEAFVSEVLVKQFNVGKIIIGYDHRFGKNRTADIHDLRMFGLKYDFEVEEISAQEIDHVSISSTKIRKALEVGDVSMANEYLGYDYTFSGTVVSGKKLGRTIGYPTANIQIPENYKLVPKNGIYIVSSVLDGSVVHGMMSVGVNPTFKNHPYTIEVNFLDWEGDLYGKAVCISIHDRIRDEERFDQLDLLIEKIQQDELITRKYFIEHV